MTRALGIRAAACGLLAAGMVAGAGLVEPAEANTTNWDWFTFLSELPKKQGCEGSPAPNYNSWSTALGGQAPSRDDVVLFSMAYPCGASPTRFLQTRSWKDWYLYGTGSYMSAWDGQAFLKLGPTATTLRNAGFWEDGPL